MAIGIIFYKERHAILEFIGAAVVFGSLVMIALQKVGDHSGESDDAKEKQQYFYKAIIFITLCAIAWGVAPISVKYATRNFDILIIHFALFSMVISGTFGITISSLTIIIGGYEMSPRDEEHKYYYMLASFLAGVFSSAGISIFQRAIQLGKTGVASLFANLPIIMQIVEEIIFLNIVPTPMAFVGIAGAFIGSTIMIYFRKDNNPNNEE